MDLHGRIADKRTTGAFIIGYVMKLISLALTPRSTTKSCAGFFDK